MRLLKSIQLWFSPSSKENPARKNEVIRELEEISAVIDKCPSIEEVYQRVKHDLVGERRADCGATGLTAEQALRAALVKEKFGLSYRELEFHLNDSIAFGEFVRLEPAKRVSKSVLNRDIRLISEETWEFFNACVKGYAERKKIEAGTRVRSDTTATATNIHHPTDASLLCDSVRVLSRLMSQACQQLSGLVIEYSNHNRRAKKRLYKINNAKNPDVRREQYRDLIRVTEWTCSYAQQALHALETFQPSSLQEFLLVDEMKAEIKHYLSLIEKVIAQSIRRVLNGEDVPGAEKVVSLFEPHTDIIKKGGRETVFGHKICVSSGKSGLILDCMILEGNPSDSSLVSTILDRHKDSYGKVPEQIAFDGGFSSADNAVAAKKAGVKDVVFSKSCGFELSEFVSSQTIFKALRNFRAGIEANISTLKRSYGFTCVLAKGWNAFKTNLLNCVAAFNLTIIARHQLRRT